ncbi:hypothetical protein VD0004_g12 [Verticillium dahliae]|uniref:Uncharacterized protein n=1 Tax=Verticillium dahliae TaxID=27337 RepID=A0AA45AQT6_VERDA|nr:hypothetical protein BJF96_g1274 [Verticillium dahliae]PNH48384.1 hypothetical protein VD0004_g12 [Verticillium dahliae]PNH57624.1 hypothetical protein VD0003_g275 [Verticillium dahliae]PNH77186.1 hypothetical protein VD0001_g430 [Verticillium dahliae]
MLPPVEQSILDNNPDFASLHHTLTTVILNPDGSTKNDILRKERESVHNHHLLTHALATATPPPAPAPKGTIGKPRPAAQPPSLPPSLLDLLILLPAFLDPSAPPLTPAEADTLLAHPPLSDLPTLLPALGPLVSTALHTAATSLVRVAHPSTNPSFLHRGVPKLAPAAVALRAEVRRAAAQTAADRLRLAEDVAALLADEARAVGLLVRALEGKHGVVARSLELRAAEVGLAARRAEVEARMVARAVEGDVYTPETVSALTNYGVHLRDARVRVEESIRRLEMELEGYGVGAQRGQAQAQEGRMREMARVYRAMEREIDEVKKDLKRLGR